jgi:hypothetical protein
MILEFLAVGVAIAVILLFLGFFTDKRHFIVAGAILLIMCGLYLGIDGLEVYGGETLTYMNITGYEGNVVSNLTVENATIPYYQTMAFGYSEGIALMLILSGLGALLVGWMNKEE